MRKLIDVHSYRRARKDIWLKWKEYARGAANREIIRQDGTTIKLYNDGKYQMLMNESMFSPDVSAAPIALPWACPDDAAKESRTH